MQKFVGVCLYGAIVLSVHLKKGIMYAHGIAVTSCENYLFYKFSLVQRKNKTTALAYVVLSAKLNRMFIRVTVRARRSYIIVSHLP